MALAPKVLPKVLPNGTYDIFLKAPSTHSSPSQPPFYLAFPQFVHPDKEAILFTQNPDPHSYNTVSGRSFVNNNNRFFNYQNGYLRVMYSYAGINGISFRKTSCGKGPSYAVGCIFINIPKLNEAKTFLFDNGVVKFVNTDTSFKCDDVYMYGDVDNNGSPIAKFSTDPKTLTDQGVTAKNTLNIVSTTPMKTIKDGVYYISYNALSNTVYSQNDMILYTLPGRNEVYVGAKPFPRPWYYMGGKLYTIDYSDGITKLFLSVNTNATINGNALFKEFIVVKDMNLASIINLTEDGHISAKTPDGSFSQMKLSTMGGGYYQAFQGAYNSSDSFNFVPFDTMFAQYMKGNAPVDTYFVGKLSTSPTVSLGNEGKMTKDTGKIVDWVYDAKSGQMYYENPFGVSNGGTMFDLSVKTGGGAAFRYYLIIHSSGTLLVTNTEPKARYFIMTPNGLMNKATGKYFRPTETGDLVADIYYTTAITSAPLKLIRKKGIPLDNVKNPCISSGSATSECVQNYCSLPDATGNPNLVTDLDCQLKCFQQDKAECLLASKKFCETNPTSFYCGCINAEQTPDYVTTLKPKIDMIEKSIPIVPNKLKESDCFSSYCTVTEMLRDKPKCDGTLCISAINNIADHQSSITGDQIYNIQQKCTTKIPPITPPVTPKKPPVNPVTPKKPPVTPVTPKKPPVTPPKKPDGDNTDKMFTPMLYTTVILLLLILIFILFRVFS
jgi:hypothetical protein